MASKGTLESVSCYILTFLPLPDNWNTLTKMVEMQLRPWTNQEAASSAYFWKNSYDGCMNLVTSLE